MLMYNYNLTLYFFIFSCLMFSFFFKHLLLILISLEFIMLNTLYMYYLITMKLNINFFLTSIFLTIMICESILGLSILVSMVRLSGNDYLKSMNLMKW
uniref:NADH-ubiquinone oxidoreductase chain 4L n=1 Tax=Elasmosoma sp. QL-2014 TaxID=1491720 RepID=A0A0U1WYI9_9HYME|nr:NADH dehydrogenase subunit 4L [Elasmosoma sp. QL-2014]